MKRSLRHSRPLAFLCFVLFPPFLPQQTAGATIPRLPPLPPFPDTPLSREKRASPEFPTHAGKIIENHLTAARNPRKWLLGTE